MTAPQVVPHMSPVSLPPRNIFNIFRMHRSLLQDISRLDSYIPPEEGTSHETQSDDVLQLFLKVWDRIPSAWKAKCTEPRGVKSTEPRDRVRVDRWSREIVTIPPLVVEHLRKWNQDPSTFLTSGASFSYDSSDNAYTRLYRFLEYNQGEATLIQNIQVRFAQMGMYDLMTRLDIAQLHRDTQSEEEFAQRAQAKGDQGDIRKRINGWTTVGGKYVSLSKDLGGFGAMICIPADISKAKLERIPPTGSIRGQAIDCLTSRGIRDMSKKEIELCYNVATKILEFLRAGVDSTFLKHVPLVVPNTQQSRKRKGKSFDRDGQKRTKQANNIADETFHQSPDAPTTEQNVNSSVDLIDTLDSPPSSDHNLTVPAQILHEPSSSSTVPHRAPGENSRANSSHISNCPEIIASQVLDMERSGASITIQLQVPAEEEEGDFWQHMLNVSPPSTFWNNDLPPSTDFWGQMDEIPI